MERFILVYVFLCFSVGIACMGVLILLARDKSDVLTRRFLWFFSSLSLLVTSGLAVTFLANLHPSAVPPETVFVIEYGESFIGRYSLMFALPFFAHQVFGATALWKDRMLAAIVAAAFVGQHVTEFVLAPVWDGRGDVAEDVLFAAIVIYTLGIGIYGMRRHGVYRPLAARFLGLMAVGLPAVLHDLFLVEDTPLRLYPLWYCLVSVTMTTTLHRRRHPAELPVLMHEWGMSPREIEVMRLVQRGMSNREIAETLHISSNTVKTHMRAIFEKSGFRSRVTLVSALGAAIRSSEATDHPS